MSLEYDDYFNEVYSETDEIIEDCISSIKKNIRTSVYEDFKELMNEKENLKELNEKQVEKINELNTKVWKLEQKIKDSHIDAFNKIFNAPKQVYASSPKREKGTKCDKCNGNRKLVFTNETTGKSVEKYCDCNEDVKFYKTHEAKLKDKFDVEKSYGKYEISISYHIMGVYNEYFNTLNNPEIFETFDESHLELSSVAYLSEDECDKYTEAMNKLKIKW